MGDKLVSILKKTSIFVSIIISINIFAEEASEKDNFSLKVISATDGLSLKKEAKIYSVNANKNGMRYNRICLTSLSKINFFCLKNFLKNISPNVTAIDKKIERKTALAE